MNMTSIVITELPCSKQHCKIPEENDSELKEHTHQNPQLTGNFTVPFNVTIVYAGQPDTSYSVIRSANSVCIRLSFANKDGCAASTVPDTCTKCHDPQGMTKGSESALAAVFTDKDIIPPSDAMSVF